MTQSATSAIARNGLGITTLLLAVIGLLSGLVRLPWFIALTFGMLAVLLGFWGWSRTHRWGVTNRTMTLLGTALGIGTVAVGIWGAVGIGGAVGGWGAPGVSGISTQRGAADRPVDPAAMKDVAVVDCSVTSGDGVRAVNATVKITNTTDRAQTYLTTINVRNASGTRIGRINTASNSLGSGQSVTVSGMDASDTAVSGTRRGPASCVVVNVNRIPATMSCPPGEVDAKLC
jgi:hypothetical protein